jgi:hypothetical protein
MFRATSPIDGEGHWDNIIRPRRAHTTDLTIHDGNFITDNRREKNVHYDHSQTINNSYNRTVFNGPIQGYVRSARNAGAVNGFVQITNVSHQVGGLGNPSPRDDDGLHENPSPIRTGKHFRTPVFIYSIPMIA